MSDSHKKQSDAAWRRKLTEFAITGETGRGFAPQVSDGVWHAAYNKIKDCPVTRNKKNKHGQPLLFGHSACTCQWPHSRANNNQISTNTHSNTTSIAPPPAAPVTIPFNIRKEPTLKLGIHDIRNRCQTYPTPTWPNKRKRSAKKQGRIRKAIGETK